MDADWLTMVKNAKKTCIVEGNLRKVHYLIDKGKEMVEEYNMDTDVMTRRAWRLQTNMGGEGSWEVELGDPEPNMQAREPGLIRENPSEPILSKRLTKANIEWRIRNLPYPPETYSVTTDHETRCLVVRTTNRKFFKKIPIVELDRVNLKLEQERVSFYHKFNTLVISYRKPPPVVELENNVLKEVKKLDVNKANMESLSNCNPS